MVNVIPVRDTGQTLQIRDCPGSFGTVGTYAILIVQMRCLDSGLGCIDLEGQLLCDFALRLDKMLMPISKSMEFDKMNLVLVRVSA